MADAAPFGACHDPSTTAQQKPASGREDKMLAGQTRDGGVKPPLRSSAVGPARYF